MIFRMVYKSGQIFLPFCQNAHVVMFDRRTTFSSLVHVGIPCSAEKMNFLGLGFQRLEHYRQTDTQTDVTENVTTWH